MATKNYILSVCTKGGNYDIIIGDGIAASAADYIAKVWQGKKILVISDDVVFSIYGEPLCDQIKNVGAEIHSFYFAAGEKSKTTATLGAIYDTLAKLNFSRSDLIVAFGGGVVGDIAGFAAATYMRGVAFVQIPTTLLAQVDSSVGGKTAVNLEGGKNLVGAFWQPLLVISDVKYLQTLDNRQLSCGMAEVIKTAAISDEEFFASLEDDGAKLTMEDIIYNCCKVKGEIVAGDELDKGRRMILNFGHTFGHAVEKEGGFTEYNHGEAVAVGMQIAAQIGVMMGETEKDSQRRLDSLIKKHTSFLPQNIDIQKLLPHILLDKKINTQGITFIIITKIGTAKMLQIPVKELEKWAEGVSL